MVKVVIDPRMELRSGRAKVFNDVTDIEDPEVLAEIDDAMAVAEWTDDPGTGRAVLLRDGRELLNPIPVAPPAHILAMEKEPSVNQLVERAIARHMEMLRGDEPIDTEEEMNDFGEDEEYHPISQFEAIVLMAEAPAVPADPPPREAVEDVKALEAALGDGGGGKKPPKKPVAPLPDPEED